MADDASGMRPTTYLIVQFPGNKLTGEAFIDLVDLVDTDAEFEAEKANALAS